MSIKKVFQKTIALLLCMLVLFIVLNIFLSMLTILILLGNLMWDICTAIIQPLNIPNSLVILGHWILKSITIISDISVQILQILLQYLPSFLNACMDISALIVGIILFISVLCTLKLIIFRSQNIQEVLYKIAHIIIVHGIWTIMDKQCSICFQNKVNIKLKCGHFFHAKCISRWKQSSNKCPYCRRSIQYDLRFD